MKSCLTLNWLKFHHIIHDTTASTHQVTLYSQKNDILCLWLIACCKLAPTLARQMWRHNDVIGRNEYLIYTFSESTFPWVYSPQFLFKFTHPSWRYERKCEWVFFSEHSVFYIFLQLDFYFVHVCCVIRPISIRCVTDLINYLIFDLITWCVNFADSH